MKKAFVSVLLIFFAVLLIAFPDIGEEAVRNSMMTAVKSVIPSLFSFMVLSDMIISSGLINEKSKLLSPVSRLFGVSKSGAAVFLLGNLSGFPTGARLAARQCESGVIASDEALRLAVISNNVSTAFVISFVGSGLFSNRVLGVTMYFCQLAAAVIIGIIMGRLSKRKKCADASERTGEIPKKAAGTFVGAVNDAASACLGICAFIVVFGVISSYIKVIFESCLSLPSVLTAILTSFLEISNGCLSAGELSFPVSVAVCAFAVGFSGISVLCQSSMFLRRAEVPLLPIAAAKIFQGILTAIFTLVSVERLNISCEAAVTVGATPAVFARYSSVCAAVILGIYLLIKTKSALQMKHST